MGQDMAAAGRIVYLGKELGLNLSFDAGVLFYKWVSLQKLDKFTDMSTFGSVNHVSFSLKSAQSFAVCRLHLCACVCVCVCVCARYICFCLFVCFLAYVHMYL